jgi:hypothetical protein
MGRRPSRRVSGGQVAKRYGVATERLLECGCDLHGFENPKRVRLCDFFLALSCALLVR